MGLGIDTEADKIRPIPEVDIDEQDEANIKLMQAGAFLMFYNLGHTYGNMLETITDVAEVKEAIGDLFDKADDVLEQTSKFGVGRGQRKGLQEFRKLIGGK